MTILVDYQIREKINSGFIKVSPFDVSLINPNSLDLRLGGNFSNLLPTDTAPVVTYKTLVGDQFGILTYDDYRDGQAIDPTNKTSFQFIPRDSDEYLLMPGTFVLASLLEDIELPGNICAEIRGKSSLGRLGLDNSSVAGWVDAGWSGVLTIELSNHGSHPIILTKGMKIGQMVFHQTVVCERPYSETGRYYKQRAGEGSKGV